jgi:hypothetical protein
MKDNPRNITLTEVSPGKLIQESTRAFLHGGAPCALLTNVIAGARAYIAQSGVVEDMNFVEGFISDLEALQKKWKEKYDEYYK